MTGLPIGIDVLLPPDLERKEIVTRQAGHTLQIRGREQWTTLFQTLVLHRLATDVADRLPAGMVILPGQPQPVTGLRGLDVVFEELAAGPQPSLVVDARWTLHTPSKPDVAGREHFDVPLGNLESASIATGMSRALATLANRIAANLAGR